MKYGLAHIFLLLTLTTCPLRGQDKIVVGGTDGLDPFDDKDNCSVLMALSGGGARGLSAIGIFRAFEEKGIRVRAIAGTSIGGIVGGLYAAGYTPDQLTSIVAGLDFSSLLSNSPSRKTMFLTQRQERDRHLISVRFDGLRPIIPQALTAGQKLTAILTALTTKASYHSASDFSRLPIPFTTISTDIVSGREVILDKGSMADAMRATMAFPLAFTGVEKDGCILMDGGMVTPVPVSLVRSMCDSVDFVVAVNTVSKLAPKGDLVTPVDIANQVTSIMTADQLAAQLAMADYVIEPPIDGYNSIDFDHKDSIIAIGYRAGLAAADSIAALIKDRETTTLYAVDRVGISTAASGSADRIAACLAGNVFTGKALVSELKRLVITLGLFRIETNIVSVEDDINDTARVSLSICAYEHLKPSEVSLRFTGNTIHDDTTLANRLIPSDSAITPLVLEEGIDRIIDLYRVDGYDLVDVRQLDIDPATRTISVDIDEAIVRTVDVDNNKRTKDWFIKSYFALQPGEPYSTARASEDIANIYGTDLFNRVTVDVQPSDSGALVTIGVEEKKYRQLRLGWHWDDEYRSEEFLELLDDNVGGIGLQYLVHARYGLDRQRYDASFKTDRILSTYLTSRLCVFHRRLDRQLYRRDVAEAGIREENKTGIEIIVGQQIKRLGTVSAGLTVEEVEYQHSETGSKERFGLRIINIRSLVENFNRIPFPTEGKKHLFRVELAGKYLGGDVEFTKFFSSLEAYFPVGKYLNYHPKLSIGVSRSGLPPSEQFYLGGSHSFVGFRTHQLAGDKIILLSNELRVKLPLKLYFTARYDMGEVYAGADQIKLRNLRHGVGALVTIDLPIGPLEFGYGVADRDIDHTYINIGLAF